ncbi:3-oxoacyl-[acyl-carrier-protein] reductase FabG [Aquicella siphonis]|uniref:3-oxoacyl-[acyl-carrier-protein] reductase FabG n=1 Tax=Aquicella siphonis TaxID=254247 RepID=A0A5E4PF80_9COXI|nr:SDR family oxidoreductase [Aquicella siphonis]VVC75640.1 3-oxoacyl-[acyl-carrier-protein] reductase FabG [Aquicella siphonis]
MHTSHHFQGIALVTGGNRGLGLETCRQLAAKNYLVLMGSRDPAKGRAAADTLYATPGLGGKITPCVLDVTDEVSIQALYQYVNNEYGCLDILINNAGIHYDTWETASDADIEGTVQEALDTNLLGAWRMIRAFMPLIRQSAHGRIVNVSSGSGSITAMGAGPPAYQVSKAALNALTRTLAGELEGSGILVNAVCPGWVATDMGGAGGGPVSAGAASIVWAATLPDNGPHGGFYRHGKPIPW